jgi:hypothetical protein
MSSSILPDIEGHGTWHTGPAYTEEELSSFRGWRALWARSLDIAMSFLRPESGSMLLKDISNKEGALLST